MNVDAEALARAFERVGAKCRGDAQFVQATKFWNGTLRLGIGQTVLLFRFDEGELQSVSEGDDDPFDEPGNFGFDASIQAWNKLLLRSPDSQQLVGPGWSGDVVRTGDRATYWRYYPVLRRLIELASQELK